MSRTKAIVGYYDELDKKEEVPENQFTGWWIPGDIALMFQDGKLTANELVLLAMIDGLVKRGGPGCFASNEYLAKRMGFTAKSVSNMIARLRKMKLLRQTKFDGRKRYLETRWSRIKH